jgi:hypothetical protein
MTTNSELTVEWGVATNHPDATVFTGFHSYADAEKEEVE